MFKNNEMPYPRGKELGGSSMMNAMLYVRGHSKDYDEWEKMGNPGWSYKDVLPYFKKSEKFVGADKNKEKFHGTKGSMTVEAGRYSYPIDKIVLQALKNNLLNLTGDVNGELEDGGIYDPVQITTATGKRMGTYAIFVEPILDRTSITILTHATVQKVLVSSQTATGVVLERFGQTYHYYAKHDVVLSAGAIGSPQILMLSGVGPKKHLKELNIPLIKDLPVGKNLQDHCVVMQPLETGHSGTGFTNISTIFLSFFYLFSIFFLNCF
jgi:choline dehydrogenase